MPALRMLGVIALRYPLSLGKKHWAVFANAPSVSLMLRTWCGAEGISLWPSPVTNALLARWPRMPEDPDD
jgi:hypothetical protein